MSGGRKRSSEALTETEWAFLNDVEPDGASPRDLWELRFDHGGRTRKLWSQYREAVLSGWAERLPGTRPSLWWVYDAPRDPAGAPRGAMPHEVPADPRRRIGGRGQPMHEVSAYVARYAFGLPIDWLRQASDQGAAGLPIDPEKPPHFETQAAYLDRRGLLTTAERRALKRKPSPSGEAVPP